MGNLVNLPNISPDSIIIDNNEKSGRNNKKGVSFSEKNYLNTHLDSEHGETSKTITIRLLPMDLETGNPFVKLHSHVNVPVPAEVSASGRKSYFCLGKENKIDHERYGDKCPFCEMRANANREAAKEKDPIKKKSFEDVAKANQPRDTVIMRCIQRGKEDEGVKFWKINVRYDKTDPYNAILNLYTLRKTEGERAGVVMNILDIYNGRDLNITFTEGNGAPQILDASISTPLSNDEEQMKAWIYDEKKWEDVFAVKPYEYLKLVSEMRVPWYDRDQNKWVDKEEYDASHKDEEKKADDEIQRAEEAAAHPEQVNEVKPIEEPKQDIMASMTIQDDDLPF